MSIEIISGKGGAVLTDTVDGMAFGPVFEDTYEADAFIRWFDNLIGDDTKRSGRTVVGMLKRYPYDDTKDVADKWREAIDPSNHTPQTCPLCHPDYPYGYVAERDSSDGSGTYLAVCGCECHNIGWSGRDRG